MAKKKKKRIRFHVIIIIISDKLDYLFIYFIFIWLDLITYGAKREIWATRTKNKEALTVSMMESGPPQLPG